MVILRAHLHQASASMLRQLRDDACDSVLIENNGVTPDWGCNLFSSDSTNFNENRIASIMSCCSIDADAWCKGALTQQPLLGPLLGGNHLFTFYTNWNIFAFIFINNYVAIGTITFPFWSLWSHRNHELYWQHRLPKIREFSLISYSTEFLLFVVNANHSDVASWPRNLCIKREWIF